ncbi:hypothetical protein CI238_03994 [Colletotrichum incanum]|uniref:Uncharacterized protein n=1 Tax=Colletotrichum incanum TaxID=1573173 RepID=A0A162Q4S4_COLIC|nr:hypothetical protein CI238_03994 [Colletotrichum incanum]
MSQGKRRNQNDILYIRWHLGDARPSVPDYLGQPVIHQGPKRGYLRRIVNVVAAPSFEGRKEPQAANGLRRTSIRGACIIAAIGSNGTLP